MMAAMHPLLDEAEAALAAGDLGRAHRALTALAPPLPAALVLLLAELEVAHGTDALLAHAVDRLTELEASDAEDGERAWAQVLLGAARACQGDDLGARRAFEVGLAHDEAWSRGEYGAAYVGTLIELGDFVAADGALAEVEAESPEGVAARAMRARWLRRQERPGDALAVLRLEQGPADDPALAFEAACAYHALGEAHRARSWARVARRVQPTWFARALRFEPPHLRPE